MCCRSSAPPLALLTPAAAPGAAPDCPRLLRLLWTWTSSEEPSPGLRRGVQQHVKRGKVAHVLIMRKTGFGQLASLLLFKI